MQMSRSSRPRRSRRAISCVLRLTVPALTSVLAACATLGGRTPKAQNSLAANTAPDWLSRELGCDRTQMDYRWNHERYGSTTDTDSACVVLGRWGRPAFSSISHYFDTGTNSDTELAQVQLSWHTTTPNADVSIRAYKVSPDYPNPMSSYFKIDRTTQPPFTPDTSHAGVIAGSVFDTLGYPLHRAVRVCAERYDATQRTFKTLGCTTTSIAGTFRLDTLPLGSVSLNVTCEATHLFWKRIPQTFTADAARKPGTVVMLINTSGCDERPVRTISRTFRGLWRSGFEMSDFTPCPTDSWALASDTGGVGHSSQATYAWVTSLPDREASRWPESKSLPARPIAGGYISYVEWHGTVTGPGHYGHLGVASFKISVDSVITRRAPSATDCK